MIERARTWVETARHAPSGDNSQPWQVGLAARGDQLTLTLSLDDATRAAPSLFDCGFVASYLSLGAFAQNFTLLAASEGCALTELREETGRFMLTFAPVAARPETPDTAGIASLIHRRTTNRLPFKKDPLSEEVRAALKRRAGENPGQLTLREFVGEPKSRLASLFFALDLVRYRNGRLYREFLEKLRFGAEAQQSPDGLRDTTLGAPAPALLFLRLLRASRNVRAVHALFFLGLERIMAFVGCLDLIRRSAAVFVLTAEQDSPLDWFRLGMGFQDLWLEVTRQGLSLQPLGTTLLVYREKRERRGGGTPTLNNSESGVLQALGTRFQTEFGLDLAKPIIAFRVGHGPAITNTSLRRPVVTGS
jgi:hypothetical protein